MHRFFLDKTAVSNGTVQITGEELEHVRVLRLRAGETITVCDGSGTDYVCRYAGLSGDTAEAGIVETFASPGEPHVKCAVYTAFAKGDRLEYAVQKSVELGASCIALFPSVRCVVQPDEKAVAKKLTRLQKIAHEAAKQSGRGIIPPVTALRSFDDVLVRASGADLPLFFYEEERTLGLKTVLDARASIKSAAIITGPEGGFEPFEAELAVSRGLTSVSLGKRILRCETAPVAALTALMFATGNL